jgi:hypothetical protein
MSINHFELVVMIVILSMSIRVLEQTTTLLGDFRLVFLDNELENQTHGVYRHFQA